MFELSQIPAFYLFIYPLCWLLPDCCIISGDTTTWRKLCTTRTWDARSSRLCWTSFAASSWWPTTRIPSFPSSSPPWISGAEAVNLLAAKCSSKTVFRNRFAFMCKDLKGVESVSSLSQMFVYNIKLFCSSQTCLKEFKYPPHNLLGERGVTGIVPGLQLPLFFFFRNPKSNDGKTAAN